MDPTRIGPWLIERRLGAGGMGTVYLARHAETSQVAAVKTLSPGLARESGFVARFTREIDALKKLTNPHVVQLYESGVDGETWYYAMEYVEGETLTQCLLRTKRIEWREVIDLTLQICTALKAAHDAGIIHRDLKPSNLLIAPDGTVKLTDFGVAQVFAAGKLTVTGGIIGTAEYMSPEQAEGRRATKHSDLYSLGAVMYAMLTGRPPFTGRQMVDVLHKHRYGIFDRPSLFAPDVPRWLEEIVCKLLEKDPDKRFPDAYVLSRRIQEGLARMELTAGEATLAADADPGDGGLFDDTGPTQPAGVRHSGPGMGTLMRELVRAEVEQSMQPSPVGRLLNSTWVLLGLLALLILGGVLWFRESELTPEERFERGVALLEQPEGPQWLEARDEHFLPLIEADPERWRERADPYLDQIAVYELKSRLESEGRRRRNSVPQAGTAGEAVRFLQLARQYEEQGDFAAAERTLAALDTLLAGDPQYEAVHTLTRRSLDELRRRRAESADRQTLLQSTLERADRLADNGRRDEAAALWTSLLALYGSDPSARDAVAIARDRLGLSGPPLPEESPADP